MAELQVVPARKGKAVRLAKGQHLKCINTHGTQVLDMWAYDAHDLGDLMSMHHTHSCLKRLVPREVHAHVGVDQLYGHTIPCHSKSGAEDGMAHG